MPSGAGLLLCKEGAETDGSYAKMADEYRDEAEKLKQRVDAAKSKLGRRRDTDEQRRIYILTTMLYELKAVENRLRGRSG